MREMIEDALAAQEEAEAEAQQMKED